MVIYRCATVMSLFVMSSKSVCLLCWALGVRASLLTGEADHFDMSIRTSIFRSRDMHLYILRTLSKVTECVQVSHRGDGHFCAMSARVVT